MIFSFRLFQLGYLAAISAESVSLFFLAAIPMSESISLSFYLSACCSLTLSVGLFGPLVVKVSPSNTAANTLNFECEYFYYITCRGYTITLIHYLGFKLPQ